MSTGINLKVQVDRKWLSARLRDNQKKHISVFEKTIERYKSEAVAHFLKVLEDVKKGKSADYFHKAVPTNHTTAYELVIKMLENSTEQVITIGADDFRSFVNDEWNWSRDWKTSSSSYGVDPDEE